MYFYFDLWTYLFGYFFFFCTGLTEINLPNSITGIGSAAFYGCSNLQKFYSQITLPPTVDYLTFGLVNQTSCQLIVPTGSRITYLISDYWKLFSTVSESSFSTLSILKGAGDFTVVAQNQTIDVDGLIPRDSVELFTTNGVLAYSAKAVNRSISIQIEKGRCYLVKVQGSTVKVVL